MAIKFGVAGSGSWATALVKILTDNGHRVNWCVRSDTTAGFIKQRHHNPKHLTSAVLNTKLLHLTTDLENIAERSDIIILAMPSAYVAESLHELPTTVFKNKKILSAIKGILPGENILLNEYLERHFDVSLKDYFAVLGPCHAEEVAAEKLSYLTFSGVDEALAIKISGYFRSPFINTVVNTDILGVQYAAVLKNIYALGAGIAHGLDYGDNFQSVYIANSADEMAGFLRKFGAEHIVVGEHADLDDPEKKYANYSASVYLGDLLVTCYSLHSRNRTFGNMIGKGYSVQAAQLELRMVAEGYNAARCIYDTNKSLKAEMPIAATIYSILWEGMPPAKGFEKIEGFLI
ncbi:NAD(P)H-dependent glycerol-3-phosphate dehydrogenase [Niabella beijingensis]|uniref:NAD(P)H-dependent glycerol-3-phosphate dehydrogenase n=1 Tax=Niabella beijingensis TaxID=2872700 RepID=UPI001CBA7C3B|nr:NAD(P)H-dependent glycerol-3-phosphate dehydrogenase [Niabella beijingensis]MBZ4190345.1 NAD(P)-binding domain-containing protein [Niabella beijingensis]